MNVARFQAELDKCARCGYCTFWCPVYQEEPLESSVARGKIEGIRAQIATQGGYSQDLADKLNRCLLCMTCTQHCLFGVQTANVITAGRGDMTQAKGIGFPFNLIYRQLIPHRTLFGNSVRVASWLQRVLTPRTEGVVRHLPFFLSALGRGRAIPSIAPRFLRQMVPIINVPPAGVETRMRVGYFIGCMTDFVFPNVGKHVISFLTKNGVEVIVPREQGCCGAPVYLGAGDFDTGRRLADVNVAAFGDVDYIIASCATCASAIKDYARFLADTPERQAAYTQFAAKTKDITEFLVDILKLPASTYQAAPGVKGKKITWHDPCHLNRHLGIKDQPREIIRSIPGIEYTEMLRPDWCCGMGGAFSLHYYDLSKNIANKKLETIKDTGADILVTDCPGCMTQFMDNTVRHKIPIKIMHIMELLG